MGKPYPQIIIHVIGNRGVGKHSLTTMFTKGWLPDKKEDESHTKKLKMEKLKYEIVVKIFNDSELEEYGEQTKHAILLVYSLSDQSTFQPIRSEDSAIRKAVSQSEVPVVLVANKVDEATLSRQVEEEVGKKAAKELNFLDFFETAATCNRNVQKSFNRLIIECLEKFPELKEASKKRGSKCSVM